MSVKIAEGVVEITADAKGVGRQVASDLDAAGPEMQKAGDGIGRKVFGGLVGAWAAIGGARLVGGFLTGSVTGASDLNETISKSNAIFGDNAAKIEKWGSTSAQTIGLSQSAAIAAAAGFGDMFTQIGFTGDEAANMSTAVVQASADLGSFNNLETADVADRMSAAFRGEFDSLQAVIPNINAARVEQEALAATGKTLVSELTAQEKAAAVLAIVHEDGARAMGDFERTSDGAANQAKIATAALEDQQDKLGGLLLPAYTTFLGFINGSVIPGFADLISFIGENSDTLLLLGGIVLAGAAAYGAITLALKLHRAILIATAAGTSIMAIAQMKLNVALLANPIGLVIIAITALVAGIALIATKTTFFQDAWAVMSKGIGTAFSFVWDSVLKPVFTAIGSGFTFLFENVIKPVATAMMIVIGLWAALFTFVWQTVLKPVFDAIGRGFGFLLTDVFQPVGRGIGAAFGQIGAALGFVWNGIIKPVFSALGTAFRFVLNNVVKPVAGGISAALGAIGSTVSSVFGGISGFVGAAFQNVLGVIRGPINGIIGLVNGMIGSLNRISVRIPSWVPVVGGQTFGVNLPRIPMLARGTNNAPDAFIAGEAGPELVTGARGATVRPFAQSRDMLAQMLDRQGGGRAVTVNQTIVHSDPILAARQAAREFSRYMGVA